jgi:hypothetical protein
MATKNRRKRDHQTGAKVTMDPTFPLAEEVRTYETHLPGWADREGQFVLIKGHDILGFYPRDEEALVAGYKQLGAGPFLVKQILRHEPIYQVGNIEL